MLLKIKIKDSVYLEDIFEESCLDTKSIFPFNILCCLVQIST